MQYWPIAKQSTELINNMDKLLIGGHVSAAGGISEAPGRLKAIGGNVLQFFSASPRVWKRMEIAREQIEKFNQLKSEYHIEKSVIHAIYLLNLASENPELATKSREVIEFDLRVDGATNGSGVVVHLGSHQGRGFEQVKDQLVDQIKQILVNTPQNSTFLIENSAGQNGKIASELTEIKWLIDSIGSPRVGWCLDTCHAHANGYSLLFGEDEIAKTSNQDQAGLFAEQEKNVNLLEEISRLDLWEALRVVHVNDSRDLHGSGRDRHANIGEGEIGNETFRSFLSHPSIRTKPLILEVPGVDGKSGPDSENIERIKTLCQ